jgi:type IV pilus assembly protein PilO
MASFDLRNAGMLRLALSVLLAGTVLGIFFFTHFLPIGYLVQKDRLATLEADFQKKSTELARARQSVADLPRFEAEYEQLHERWTVAQELLPSDHEIAGLLRKITLAGQQAGVQFVLFKPNALQVSEHYSALPVDIQVAGDYHAVGSFLAELSNMRRIVTVSNLRIEANTKPDKEFTTQASLTASAYCLNTASVPSPATKTGTTNERKSS